MDALQKSTGVVKDSYQLSSTHVGASARKLFILTIMEPPARPTIKGVFVKSHIAALERQRGKDSLAELRRRFGKSIDFKNNENVSVADEVKILETIVDMQEQKSLMPNELAEKAGRLHFRNFSTTPLWRIISPVFGRNLKLILMHSRNIAGHVFQGVKFAADDLGENKVRISMGNNDYSPEHFKGFFEEWITSSGLEGQVQARMRPQGVYEYDISWWEKKSHG